METGRLGMIFPFRANPEVALGDFQAYEFYVF